MALRVIVPAKHWRSTNFEMDSQSFQTYFAQQEILHGKIFFLGRLARQSSMLYAKTTRLETKFDNFNYFSNLPPPGDYQ